MTDQEMIERRCEDELLRIEGWRETEDGETAVLGRFVVTTDDFEDDGLYYDEEGELTACVVGAEQYGNRRVCFSFTADGMDSGVEVRQLAAIERADD